MDETRSSAAAATSESPATTQSVTVLGQLGGLGVLLLPAAGAAIRALGFATDTNFGDWIRVGVASPVAVLAAVGAQATLVILPLYALTGLTTAAVSRLDRHESRIGSFATEWVRARGWRRALVSIGAAAAAAVVLALCIASVVSFAVIPDFPLSLIAGLAGFVASAYAIRRGRRQQRITLGTAWPILALGLIGIVGAGVASGGGLEIAPGRYTFAAGSPTHDGVYVRLGEAGDVTYLHPCGGKVDVVAVKTASVVAEEFLRVHRRQPPSLYDIVIRHRRMRLGLHYPCP